ncbi:MAG: hypothetical protein ACTSRP_09470 [Candidatus Helarchaeota archaeon]
MNEILDCYEILPEIKKMIFYYKDFNYFQTEIELLKNLLEQKTIENITIRELIKKFYIEFERNSQILKKIFLKRENEALKFIILLLFLIELKTFTGNDFLRIIYSQNKDVIDLFDEDQIYTLQTFNNKIFYENDYEIVNGIRIIVMTRYKWFSGYLRGLARKLCINS